MMMIPKYNTKTFTQIWSNATSFLNDYQANGIPVTISLANAETLFYLLYAAHGNDPIANLDENQFKARVFSVIFRYGPTWEKRLSIQESVRSLSEAELLAGSNAIYNHAYNPNQSPTTDTDGYLEFLNEQNVTKYKRNKLDAYTILWDLLKTDVTTDFINKFKKLFKTLVRPMRPTLFVTDVNEEEES